MYATFMHFLKKKQQHSAFARQCKINSIPAGNQFRYKYVAYYMKHVWRFYGRRTFLVCNIRSPCCTDKTRIKPSGEKLDVSWTYMYLLIKWRNISSYSSHPVKSKSSFLLLCERFRIIYSWADDAKLVFSALNQVIFYCT